MELEDQSKEELKTKIESSDSKKVNDKKQPVAYVPLIIISLVMSCLLYYLLYIKYVN